MKALSLVAIRTDPPASSRRIACELIRNAKPQTNGIQRKLVGGGDTPQAEFQQVLQVVPYTLRWSLEPAL